MKCALLKLHLKIITPCKKQKQITFNLTNPCFISATFRACFFIPFSSLMMKKSSYKYYNKQIATRGNGNVQSHDQEESKLNSTTKANSGVHTLTEDKIIKTLFNEFEWGESKNDSPTRFSSVSSPNVEISSLTFNFNSFAILIKLKFLVT